MWSRTQLANSDSLIFPAASLRIVWNGFRLFYSKIESIEIEEQENGEKPRRLLPSVNG